ncbi:MAG: YbaB/EbfC family nucleoid-associated protein [Flavobacteriales bacterium]|nr:YbaB/EbfC family nucleoid-associated protein [Flavobacteriales bacterium]
MFGNMMDQLQQMKQKMDESKHRLNSITVDGVSGNNKVVVTMNGNRKVTGIKVDPSLLKGDAEELEDLLILGFNHALEQAEKINESEMQSAAMGILPHLNK